MPNIEVHGFGEYKCEYVGIKNRARLSVNELFDLFCDKSYVEEMVITICPDITLDKKGENQPFLRVVSTPSPHLDEIVELLKVLNIDIEILLLKSFHLRQSG